MNFHAIALALRAIDLLPFLTFPEPEERKLSNIKKPWGKDHLKCIGNHYGSTWEMYNNGEESGWYLYEKNQSELSEEEFEKFKELCFLVNEFAIEKANELFPINKEVSSP